MANICDNDFTYYGENQIELLKFYFKLSQACEEAGGDAKTILSILGASSKEIDEIDGRTDVQYVELLTAADNKVQGVRFMASSAWSPCDDFAKYALLAVLPGGGDVEMCYVAEEPGCEIFINTDVDHKFYDVVVNIDVSCKDYEDQFYYGITEFTSLADMIRELSGVSITKFEDLNDIEIIKRISAGFEAKYPETDDDSPWMSLHVYSDE